jgi:hypothetical protein
MPSGAKTIIPMSLRTRLIVLLCTPLLASCDMLYDVLDIPDPQARAAAAEAEGRAIGGGCRHSGRSLEDCYTLNTQVSKAAVFTGWREMNDYMLANNLPEVPSQMTPPGGRLPAQTPAPLTPP